MCSDLNGELTKGRRKLVILVYNPIERGYFIVSGLVMYPVIAEAAATAEFAK